MYNTYAYSLGTNRCCIRDVAEYGQQRAKEVGPENIFDYSIGNPAVPPPQEIADTIRQILADTDPMAIHSYTSAQGDLATRQAIATDLNNRFGCDITPEELFMGTGASQELSAVFHALAFPGCEFITIAPYFPEYRPFVEAAGGQLRIVPADMPDFQIRLDLLEQMLTPNTAAVIVNSPNNPSGTVYSRQTLEKLAQLLTKKSHQLGHPIYIVSDEPYRELVYDGTEVPFLPLIYPNTLICYSYSKSLSLPGERIGYIYVPRQATDSQALYAAVHGASRSIGHICAPSLWQKVLARCAHLRPNLESYDRNRKLLYNALIDAGYTVAKPQGAFYLFVKAPDGDSKGFSRRAMALDLLVVPGDDFGCPEYFRICYCVDTDKLQRSLPLFRQLMDQYR